MSLAVRDYGLV